MLLVRTLGYYRIQYQVEDLTLDTKSNSVYFGFKMSTKSGDHTGVKMGTAAAKKFNAAGRRMSWQELDVQSVVDFLEGNSFWHTHIQRVYAAAGFEARYVEREEVHPIWQVRLKRTTGELDADPKRARRQLLQILQQHPAGRAIKDFSLLDRRGDKMTVVFIWELGVPGILAPNPDYDQGQARLLAPC